MYPSRGRRNDPDRRCLIAKKSRRRENEDAAPSSLPAALPKGYAATDSEHDPVLESLGGLTKSVMAVDAEAALILLDRITSAANSSRMDSGLGRTGLDVDTFRRLARYDRQRVRQATLSLNDRLRRIVALAAVCQWEAGELAKVMKTAPKP